MKKDIEVFLHRTKCEFSREYNYSTHSCDMSEYGYIFLVSKNISFELQNENTMIKQEIDMLNAKAKKLKLDAYIAVENIEEKIQSLLAIEDKS